MNKKITIHDIAKELNTTGSTVSRALNNHPSISKETKELVRTAAERLNYQQNKIASSLRSGRTHVIGVIIPSAEINFFGSVVHGIGQMARSRGYNILLFQSNEQTALEREGIETLLQSNVEGIIASIAKETDDHTHYFRIKEQNIPLVLFDRANDELGVSAVVIDNYKGAYMATEHLIKQGYQRVAHISGQRHIKIFNDRLRGYRDALQANKLPIVDELIVQGEISIDSGRRCTEQLLNLKNAPDAIFAVEDFTALGAMQSLNHNGLHDPGQIGLIGFANEAFSAYVTPSLSTVDQQTVVMGKEAFKIFHDLRNQKNIYSEHPKRTVLEPLLIIRESSIRKNQ
ncbi:MAG: LacI family DNA-binding transcriptional regulator [Sphingobacteriaceae bacterium]